MAAPDTAADEKPEGVKPEAAKVEEVKPEAAKAEEVKPEESKVEEVKPEAENVEGNAPAPAEEGPAEKEGAAAPSSLPSFKEESYYVKDLKESEKKALAEFSDKVEAALKANEFVLPPVVVEVVKETVVAQATEEAVVVAATVETETKEGDVVVDKGEDSAVAVILPEALAEPEAPKEGAPKGEAAAPKEEAPKEEAVAPPKEEAEAPKEEAAAPEAQAPAPASGEEVAPSEEAAKEEPKEATEGAPTTEVAAEAPAGETNGEEKEAPPPEDLDLELWGIPLLPSKGDPRTQVVFLKFLRAREFKVKDAFTMLKNTILWRKKHGIDKLVDEDLGTEFQGTAFNHGVDKEGHPVQYNVFGLLEDKALGEAALRWRVQLLEKEIRQLSFSPGGVSSMLQVFDLKNAPLLSKKALRQFLSQAIAVMLDNYPELVVKIVLLNTPWYCSALYTFMSPFLTQRTKSKLVFGSSLFKYISPDNVPVQYGGLSRANDTEFGGGNVAVSELALKAGEKQSIDIEVTGAGAAVVWDIAILGADVTYGAEFVPSKEGGYTTVVEKPKKITILEEPIRNTFKATEPGKLVLCVDNGASRKKKSVVYRYLVKPPSPEAAAVE